MEISTDLGKLLLGPGRSGFAHVAAAAVVAALLTITGVTLEAWRKTRARHYAVVILAAKVGMAVGGRRELDAFHQRCGACTVTHRRRIERAWRAVVVVDQ